MKGIKYPIVYHKGYNMTLFGIEKIHPFDSTKYDKIFKLLIEKKVLSAETILHKPTHISRALLSRVHSRSYLARLNYSLILTRIVEIPLCVIPACLLRWRILEPMGMATQGTVDAGLLALMKGWAINLGGGFHHASYHDGSGFCVYADITLCIQHLRHYHADRVKKVMIIDLDAHQGNGHERDFMDDPDTYIIDAYNPDNYPYDFPARKAISKDIPVYSEDNDYTYLNKLRENIGPAFDEFEPSFIVYNAGYDCLYGDPFGRLHITAEGIIKRDEYIFELAFRRDIPIVMLLSGGYQSNNPEVIADSIENIMRVFNLN